MFHELAALFGADAGRLFGYLSFRAAGAAITAFLLAVLFGPRVIRWLSSLGIGERKAVMAAPAARKDR